MSKVMDNVKIFEYNGTPVKFSTDNESFVMINATEMAKKFGKKSNYWIKTNAAKSFINAVSKLKKIDLADLLIVKYGGEPGTNGTWMHEDVAFEFARWLDPEFGLWCNDVVKGLVKNNFDKKMSDEEILRKAILIANNQLEEAKKELEELRPKAKTLDQITADDKLVDIGQAAKILGLDFGRNTLFSYLRFKGIFFKNRNEPKQSYINRGYFEIKEEFIEEKNYLAVKVYVTQKGIDFLSKMDLKNLCLEEDVDEGSESFSDL
jgi:toxin-antitoxin system, toxin component, bro domain protein